MLLSEDVYTERTPRVVAARRLRTRRGRDEARQFLVEGPQAVREALQCCGSGLRELFVDDQAVTTFADLIGLASGLGVRVSRTTTRGMSRLCDTVTPQGLIAVCNFIDSELSEVYAPGTSLAAVLVNIADPGNAGTVLRTVDAVGANAVVFADDSVDPYNGKCVRASAGSLFHLPIARGPSSSESLGMARSRGIQLLAADVAGETDLDDLLITDRLRQPTAWVFGNEAHGISSDIADLVDLRVRIPIYGRAESLNLAIAAAVCLYTSARAQRSRHKGSR